MILVNQLLTAASLLSTVSSLLQVAPFVAVYKIVEELLLHAQSPAGIDRELITYWGVAALTALVAALLVDIFQTIYLSFAQPESGLDTTRL
ncbi:hypothetical protein [Brevibacillus parabrevis]|uniref:hypothetical protein n=1 Tax=Brevibacillus parabrevis TaxID=54914 RepID=UPI0036F3C528